jgi:hypothetical protein
MLVSDPIRMGFDFGAGGIKVFGQGQGSQLLSHVAVSGAQRVSRLHGLGQQKLPLEVTLPLGSFYVGLTLTTPAWRLKTWGWNAFPVRQKSRP